MRIRFAVSVCVALALTGCGYTQRDGEMIGQAKKVGRVTPLICPDYYAFDLSLGVIRGGTGSMSTQDVWFTVSDERDVAALQHAVDTGAIVRVRYNKRRVAICTEAHILTVMVPAE